MMLFLFEVAIVISLIKDSQGVLCGDRLQCFRHSAPSDEDDEWKICVNYTFICLQQNRNDMQHLELFASIPRNIAHLVCQSQCSQGITLFFSKSFSFLHGLWLSSLP